MQKLIFPQKIQKSLCITTKSLYTNSKFQTPLSRKLQRFRTCRKNKKCSIFHDLSEYIIFSYDCKLLDWSFNSTNANNPVSIHMASQETSICIYFNSSQDNTVCNYNSLFTLEFHYITYSLCECWQLNGLLNSINNSLALPNNNQFCLNTPCLNCEWHINI